MLVCFIASSTDPDTLMNNAVKNTSRENQITLPIWCHFSPRSSSCFLRKAAYSIPNSIAMTPADPTTRPSHADSPDSIVIVWLADRITIPISTRISQYGTDAPIRSEMGTAARALRSPRDAGLMADCRHVHPRPVEGFCVRIAHKWSPPLRLLAHCVVRT